MLIDLCVLEAGAVAREQGLEHEIEIALAAFSPTEPTRPVSESLATAAIDCALWGRGPPCSTS